MLMYIQNDAIIYLIIGLSMVPVSLYGLLHLSYEWTKQEMKMRMKMRMIMRMIIRMIMR